MKAKAKGKYIGFDALVEKLKNSKNPPEDPEAVASVIGRKKFGKSKFQRAAALGVKLRGAKPA